jgi:hypothetical protein
MRAGDTNENASQPAEKCKFRGEFKNGEAGIRTLGRLAPTPVFKTGAIDHSATSPGCFRQADYARTVPLVKAMLFVLRRIVVAVIIDPPSTRRHLLASIFRTSLPVSASNRIMSGLMVMPTYLPSGEIVSKQFDG